METVGKLIAAALICCALSLLLRKQAPELTLALCAVVCALCFLTVLPFFSPVLAFVRRLEEITGLSQAVFAPLFKTAAIGLLSQLAGTLCRDSGQQALGQTIEICSGFLCIYLALPLLEKKLHGFAAPDAVLTAPETRSSSPVRILRDETRQSQLRGLYPCGEGAGYAGGITSAALDGILTAEAVIEAQKG